MFNKSKNRKRCLFTLYLIVLGNKIKQNISGEKHLDKSPHTKDVEKVSMTNKINRNFSLRSILKNSKKINNIKNLIEENIPIK